MQNAPLSKSKTSLSPDVKPLGKVGSALLILAAPITVLNPILPHIGPLSAYTAFSGLILVYGLLNLRRRTPDRLRKLTIVFAIPTMLVAAFVALSNFGVPSVFGESVVVAAGLALVIGLICMPVSRDTLRVVLLGWLIASITTTAMAAIERLTGFRFAPSYLDINPYISKVGVVAVFYNPNNFAAFLAFSFVVLLAGRRLFSSPFLRAMFLFAGIAAVPVMLATSSRFGIAAIVLSSAMWIFLRLRTVTARVGLGLLSLIGAYMLVIQMGEGGSESATATPRGTHYVIEVGGLAIPSDSSLLARWNLALNGLEMSITTPLGVGPGGFEDRMRTGMFPREVFGLVNPHNGVIEFLVQYGVILTVLAFLVTFTLFSTALRESITTHQGTPERGLAIGLACALVALPLVLGMHSAFLDAPQQWLAMATFIMIGIYLRTWNTRSPDVSGVNIGG